MAGIIGIDIRAKNNAQSIGYQEKIPFGRCVFLLAIYIKNRMLRKGGRTS